MQKKFRPGDIPVFWALGPVRAFGIFGIVGFLGLFGCDGTRERRPTKSSGTGNAYSYFNPGASGFGTSPTSAASVSTGTATPVVTSNPAVPAVAIPAELKHCSWSMDGVTGYEKSHVHIGSYTLCKSSLNPLDVYLQVKTPITDAQLCIIPTTNSGNSSTYIGEPKCLMIDTNNNVYKITLEKNRPSFSSYSLTGVMLMKDKQFYYPSPFNRYALSPDAYLFCSQWLGQTGDPSYCAAFNQVGQYVYHQF
jgi:hypothetical protein